MISNGYQSRKCWGALDGKGIAAGSHALLEADPGTGRSAIVKVSARLDLL